MTRSLFWPLMVLLVALGLWLQTRQEQPEPVGPPQAPEPQAKTPTAATAVAAHGGTVWMGRQDGTLVVFGSGEPEVRVVHAATIHALRVSDSGLLSVSADGSAAAWSLDGAPLGRVRIGGRHLNDGVPLADGSALVAGDKGFVARTRAWRSPGLHGSAAFAVVVSPDGQLGASGGADGRVVVFNLADGEAVRVLRASRTWVTALDWQPEGVYVGDRDGRVGFWPDASGQVAARSYPQHPDAIVALVVAQGRVVSGSADGTGNVSDAASGARLATFRSPDGTLLDVTVSGPEALTAHKDGRIRRWRVTDGTLLGTLPTD